MTPRPVLSCHDDKIYWWHRLQIWTPPIFIDDAGQDHTPDGLEEDRSVRVPPVDPGESGGTYLGIGIFHDISC